MGYFLALCFVALIICYVIKQSNETAEEEEIRKEEERKCEVEEKTRAVAKKEKCKNPLSTKKILNEDIIQRYYKARRQSENYNSRIEKNLKENIENFLTDPSTFCLISFYKINKVTPSYIVEQCCDTYIIHKSLTNSFSTESTSNYYCNIYDYDNVKIKIAKVSRGEYRILYSEEDIALDYDFLKNFFKNS